VPITARRRLVSFVLGLVLTCGATRTQHMVLDINVAPPTQLGAGALDSPLVAGGRVFFAADDRVHGKELFVSDGTSSGTRLVSDIVPGPGSSNPELIGESGGSVLFAATAAAGPIRQIWRSDGTAAGTFQVGSFGAIPTSSAIRSLPAIAFGGRLVLWGRDLTSNADGLVAVDTALTSAALTVTFPSSYVPSWLAVAGGKLFFGVTPVLSGEVWATDGTQSGTVKLLDGSVFMFDGTFHPTALGNRLVFSAYAGSTPTLWTSDGTRAGTQPIAGQPSHLSRPRGGAVLGGKLYFGAEATAGDQALWVYDGVNAPTRVASWSGGEELLVHQGGSTPHISDSVKCGSCGAATGRSRGRSAMRRCEPRRFRRAPFAASVP
jgi:ELWxxDGT repeat protein